MKNSRPPQTSLPRKVEQAQAKGRIEHRQFLITTALVLTPILTLIAWGIFRCGASGIDSMKAQVGRRHIELMRGRFAAIAKQARPFSGEEHRHNGGVVFFDEDFSTVVTWSRMDPHISRSPDDTRTLVSVNYTGEAIAAMSRLYSGIRVTPGKRFRENPLKATKEWDGGPLWRSTRDSKGFEIVSRVNATARIIDVKTRQTLAERHFVIGPKSCDFSSHLGSAEQIQENVYDWKWSPCGGVSDWKMFKLDKNGAPAMAPNFLRNKELINWVESLYSPNGLDD